MSLDESWWVWLSAHANRKFSISENYIRPLKNIFSTRKRRPSEKYVLVHALSTWLGLLLHELLSAAALTLDLIKHTQHQKTEDIPDSRNHTLNFEQLGFFAAPFLLRTPDLITKWNEWQTSTDTPVLLAYGRHFWCWYWFTRGLRRGTWQL